MRLFQRESKRLNSTVSFVRSRFPHFGVNKKQEITRLLYEISKREGIWPPRIIKGAPKQDYHGLKRFLLQRRYPATFLECLDFQPYLPKVEFRPSQQCILRERKFSPAHIFVEDKIQGSHIVKRFRHLFPQAHLHRIRSLKDFQCAHRGFNIEDYNKRRDSVFIVQEEFDFFKECPCTQGAVGCSYHIFNLGFGCLFECTYCYLQGYTNSAGIILPANLERFFGRFSIYGKSQMRIGTGEFCDSLGLDAVTQYSLPIIKFFRKHKNITFEFKTKSACIENLLKEKPSENIVVSWSLNPQRIIDENEFFTASLPARLAAAARCIEAGYKVGFHFDPVINFRGWEAEYAGVINSVFSAIPPGRIAWISIGTLRFSPRLKQVIEKRFPANTILDGEMVLGFDRKLRYPYAVRFGIYKKMVAMLRGRAWKPKLYLCMEEPRMWEDLELEMPQLT